MIVGYRHPALWLTLFVALALFVRAGLADDGLPAVSGASFAEGFDDVGPTLPGQDGPSNLIAAGWIFRNQSQPQGPVSWYGSDGGQSFNPHSGTGLMANDWNSGVCGSGAAISNWAILPAIPDQEAGDGMSFYVNGSIYSRSDRLQVRYSPSGGTGTGSGAAAVGDFTVLLLDVNPVPKGGWTEQTITLPGDGRIAFRYFLPDLGNCTFWGGFFGIDTLVIGSPPPGPIPIPQPGQTVTWDQSISPVVITGRVIIPAGGTVLVEPGVVIQVQANSTLVLEGDLIGQGTAGQPIQLTAPGWFPPAVEVYSRLELAHAQVTGQIALNGSGELFVADSLFQGSGMIGSMSGNYLNPRTAYVQIERSHFQGSLSLHVSLATVVLHDTTFQNSAPFLLNVYLDLDNVSIDGAGLVVSRDYQPHYLNNLTVSNAPGPALSLGGEHWGNDFLIGDNVVLQNNLYPLALGSGGLVPGSTLPATGNVNNYIAGPGFGDHRGPMTWPDVGIPYVITQFPNLGRVDILAGATVKLGPNAGFEADFRSVTARGRPEAPVTIERLDPAQAWGYILTPGRLEHTIVDGGDFGLVYALLGPPGYIDSSVLRHNNRAVLGPVIIRGTQFLNNNTGAKIGFPGDLNGSANANSFVGNTLAVETAYDATYNWWGHASGPSAPSNPGGQGDPVASGVPVVPFRSEPPAADHAPLVYLNEAAVMMEPGEQVMFNWESEDDNAVVAHKVLFSELGSAHFELIATLPGSRRSFVWTVPDIGFQTATGASTLRVVAVDSAGQEGWDEASFIIPTTDVVGTVTILTDLSGPFQAGEEVQLCFDLSDVPPGTYDVSFFLDGDRRTFPLGGATTNSNCLPLPARMPFVSTDLARIGVRIGGSQNRLKWFFSDYFTIELDPRLQDGPPQVTLLSPLPGQSFAPGSVVSISWAATDDEGVRAADVHASYDGGRTWHVLARDLPGQQQQFHWQTAADATFDEVRLRLVVKDLRFHHRSATVAIGLTGSDEPITGLTAANDGPAGPGEPVNLTATVSAGTNVTYLWDLGDGQTATGAAVSHSYAAVGEYTAVVTASNAAGTATATTTVLVLEAPITGLTAANDGPTPLGGPTQFVATISGGTNVSYSWDFGDGTGGNGATASHSYAAMGEYTAVVTASNAAGSVTAATSVTVTDPDEPIQGLTAANSSPVTLAETVHLTATVAAGSNVVYAWDFGDGNMGSGATAQHLYTAVGTYTAVVTATNSSGSVTATTQVVVADVPISGLLATSDSPTSLGQATNFTATTSGGTNVVYTWDFGDGRSGVGPLVSYIYETPGTYTVTVTAHNGVGSQTATTTVNVNATFYRIYLPAVLRP
jgi:PKD repeat protein